MPKKILIIKSSSMGDIVHALPVAHDLHAAFPDARIDWVAEESFRDIPLLAPAVNSVIVTAFRRWRKHPFSSATRAEVRDIRNRLREAKYDLVVDLQGLLRSALVARWTGAETVGYSRDTIREPLASYLYTRTLRVEEKLGPVLRYRTMAAKSVGYDFDAKKLIYGLQPKAIPPVTVTGPYAALAVNTSRDEKLWDELNWVRAGQQLADNGLKSVLFWGSETERQRVERLARQIPGAVVLPKMKLTECAVILKGASVMLGVDTGLSHLSAALGVPSVGIIVGTPASLFSLTGEGRCVTLGDKGQPPSVEDVMEGVRNVTCG